MKEWSETLYVQLHSLFCLCFQNGCLLLRKLDIPHLENTTLSIIITQQLLILNI